MDSTVATPQHHLVIEAYHKALNKINGRMSATIHQSRSMNFSSYDAAADGTKRGAEIKGSLMRTENARNLAPYTDSWNRFGVGMLTAVCPWTLSKDSPLTHNEERTPYNRIIAWLSIKSGSACDSLGLPRLMHPVAPIGVSILHRMTEVISAVYNAVGESATVDFQISTGYDQYGKVATFVQACIATDDVIIRMKTERIYGFFKKEGILRSDHDEGNYALADIGIATRECVKTILKDGVELFEKLDTYNRALGSQALRTHPVDFLGNLTSNAGVVMELDCAVRGDTEEGKTAELLEDYLKNQVQELLNNFMAAYELTVKSLSEDEVTDLQMYVSHVVRASLQITATMIGARIANKKIVRMRRITESIDAQMKAL